MGPAHPGRARVRRTLPVVLTATAALLIGPAAHADPLTVVNALRKQGCDGRSAAAAVQRDSALDGAARELSRGARLSEALARADYPAASSSSYHVKGSREDATVRRMLADRYCAAVTDPKFAELGAFQSGDETWIVLAVRAASEPPLDASAVALRVLELVNAARSEARNCGRDSYAAAPPLTLSDPLESAALLHARDLAQRGELDHSGSDGSSSGDRITRVGYSWRASGENLAMGQHDADAVVAAWLESPGHCATLMGPYFTETGVAFVRVPGGNPDIYWTQVFAAPR